MSIVLSSRLIPKGYPSLGLLFFFWTAMGVLAYLRHYLQSSAAQGTEIALEMAIWLTCFLPWIALSPFMFHLERRYPLDPRPRARNLLALALGSIPVTYLASLAMVGLNVGIRAATGVGWDIPEPWWQVPFREILVQQALFWSSAIGSGVIRRFVALNEGQQRVAQLALEKAQLETNLRQAELEVLRMRMNPHFLFNSLQNIGVLAREDPEKASRMLARLGEVLRMCLRRDMQPETTLDSEVQLADAYVAVESVRFSDRLTVAFDIDPDVRHATVPNLVLQPLIENAIKHGLRDPGQPGQILVKAMREEDTLVLTVADSGVGPAAEDLSQVQLGIGLGSTCQRLERLYPEHHSVSMSRRPEGGTQVRIAIPYRVNGAAAPAYG